jgi:hypothetical protein
VGLIEGEHLPSHLGGRKTMAKTALANDASASIKGTIFQLFVAVQKCFEMVTGDKVIIERFGDVTAVREQIETKRHADALTDNHLNFWKTLKNWMRDEFDAKPYRSLILLTTQDFGPHSRFNEWNNASTSERLAMLNAIHADSEKREMEAAAAASAAGGKAPARSISQPLAIQRLLLDATKQEKLSGIVGKVFIASAADDFSAIFDRLADQYCKTILKGKRYDFLTALLGFVISPDVVDKTTWDITFDEFDAKVRSLTPHHCVATTIFPNKYLADSAPADATAMAEHGESLFVTAIKDIEYHEQVPDAIADYIRASKTILEEFVNYEVPPERAKAFAREVVAAFSPLYRSASRTHKTHPNDSQTFYDSIMATPPPPFQGFDAVPPRSFRNGVLHTQIGDLTKSLKWRLAQT